MAYALPEPPRTEPPPKFEHDIKTDVKLKIITILPEGRSKPLLDAGYACLAILPSTWFENRPLLYLGIALSTNENEHECEVPYSPEGYVVEYQEGRELDVEAELKGVLPGETREVVMRVGQ